MRKILILLTFLSVMASLNLFAVKVQFKATPMSENIIKGPYAVYVFYKIFDDTTDVSGFSNIVDLPLLKRKDIRNVTIWKSGKLIRGAKPTFRKLDDEFNKSGIVRSFGITDYDVVQGDSYAYMLYFNSNNGNSNKSKASKNINTSKKYGVLTVGTESIPTRSNDPDDNIPGLDPGEEPPTGGGGHNNHNNDKLRQSNYCFRKT